MITSRLGLPVVLLLHRALSLLPRRDRTPPITLGSDRLEVRESPIHGRGVFAREPVAAGELLCEYAGTRLTFWEILRTRSWRYLYNYDFEHWIDAGPHDGVMARYINHDPRASCAFAQRDRRVFIQARRAIQAGEELTLDYGDLYWKHER